MIRPFVRIFSNPPNSLGSLHSFRSSFIKNAPRFARRSIVGSAEDGAHRMDRDVICPLISEFVRIVVLRLSDSNSHVAVRALATIVKLSKWDNVGATFLAQIALLRMHKWEEKNTRAVAMRLRLLTELLEILLDSGDSAKSAGVLASSMLKFAWDLKR